MHQIDTATAATVRPSIHTPGTPGWFSEGNPGAGTPATIPGADWFNDTQAALLAVLTAGGITPTKGPSGDTDLVNAIRALAQKIASDSMVLITHELPNNTAGDSYTTGSWQKCSLTFERHDTGNHASLASSVVTLAAGTWYAEGRLYVALGNIIVQTRLYNTTAGAVLVSGTPMYTYAVGGGSAATVPSLTGIFDLAAPSALELQINAVAAGGAAYCAQYPANFGTSQLFASLLLRKLA